MPRITALAVVMFVSWLSLALTSFAADPPPAPGHGSRAAETAMPKNAAAPTGATAETYPVQQHAYLDFPGSHLGPHDSSAGKDRPGKEKGASKTPSEPKGK